MRSGRAIFAVLLAVAVAALPASLGFVPGAAAATTVSVVEAMPDCDHHHRTAPAKETQKTADRSACLAACAATCIGVAAADVSGIAYLAPVAAALKPVRSRIDISSLMGSPPFRPPRA